MNSFKEFLSESNGYVYSLADIKKKYDDYNKSLFGGKLPSVKLGFNRRKSPVASVTSTPIKEGRRIVDVIPNSMSFSTQYVITPEQFEGLLLHEMAHVATVKDEYVYGTGRDNGHGRFFNAELDRLRKKVSFDIPAREEDYEFAKSDKTKTSYVILQDKGGKTNITFVTKKGYDGDDLIRAAQWWKERAGGEYTIGTTTSEVAKEYKATRAIWKGEKMKMGFYTITPEKLEDVMNSFVEKVKY